MITTNKGKVWGLLCLAIGVSLIGVGCNSGGNSADGPAAKQAGSEGAPAGEKLSGSVKIDGSSTVYPVSEAVAEEFRGVQPDVRVTVGFSGTGGGMKKFIAGEVDICDASRAMKEKEATACKEQGIEFIELSVAFDGLAVIVNPKNTWCDCLTVGQLKELWRPGKRRQAVEGSGSEVAGQRHQTVWSGNRLGYVRLLHRSNCGRVQGQSG